MYVLCVCVCVCACVCVYACVKRRRNRRNWNVFPVRKPHVRYSNSPNSSKAQLLKAVTDKNTRIEVCVCVCVYYLCMCGVCMSTLCVYVCILYVCVCVRVYM